MSVGLLVCPHITLNEIFSAVCVWIDLKFGRFLHVDLLLGIGLERGEALSSHHIWTFIPFIRMSVCPSVRPPVHTSVRPSVPLLHFLPHGRTGGQTDGHTDGWNERPYVMRSGAEALSSCHILMFSLSVRTSIPPPTHVYVRPSVPPPPPDFALQTDGRTDGQMDGRTDGMNVHV
jgi:hypothetical protein